ncbi:MAG: LysR family transcriptional regulator [Verrucomicrobiota bacterium]
MFTRLFAQSGLSLDRLRALVEVGAAGSIVRAADADPARQSQYSRQIKDLEDFFQAGLVERHGKGIRLTVSGRELARISRFFLLGLSNFQRGCLAEGQTYRIGASPTFIASFLLPVLAEPTCVQSGIRFAVEAVLGDEVERRLHDLTLDFGVIDRATVSRPLQLKELGVWRLKFWVPKALCKTTSQAERAFADKRLPVVWPAGELPVSEFNVLEDYEAALTCANFLEARVALEQKSLAAFLPDFLSLGTTADRCLNLKMAAVDSCLFHYRLAWNPRLLRLNPHARRRRDVLVESLARKLSVFTGGGGGKTSPPPAGHESPR